MARAGCRTASGPVPAAFCFGDRGTREPEADPGVGLEAGSLASILRGETPTDRRRSMRLQHQARERQVSWPLIRSRDPAARQPTAQDIRQERSQPGRTVEAIAAAAV